MIYYHKIALFILLYYHKIALFQSFIWKQSVFSLCLILTVSVPAMAKAETIWANIN
ncbi:hypothetical protein ROSEINA2194_02927 [Roseburia inulinivorans DSM 16841]|uniref:Uncharacterized protein n=1 Tax=Roseburia inulinivorans DSM 16841 TaxID=622312 RepID=C0FW01_9FIRM|nr:hypothetical protein ROSEINA2194_02927 [Roseburia inulinivorans DSM 16841]